MRILIDARFYGLENTGIGRYIVNLIEELQKEDTKNDYIILLKQKYFNSLSLNKNWTKVTTDIGHYSFSEQLKLLMIINKYHPDLVHFPHFNIPIFYTGKFVVTIHDMTMHTQTTNASNLSLPIYFIKHLVYKFVFSQAVLRSQKILVPSEFVKSEILKNYSINENKIVVIYEGVK